MKLPRDLSGAAVVAALERLGFAKMRQTGSHIQMAKDGLRVTIPNHPSIAPGTLKSILRQAGVDLPALTSKL